MASQSQGIQQLLQAEKRAAEKVSEARKREFGVEAARRGASPGIAARPRGVVGALGPKNCGLGVGGGWLQSGKLVWLAALRIRTSGSLLGRLRAAMWASR